MQRGKEKQQQRLVEDTTTAHNDFDMCGFPMVYGGAKGGNGYNNVMDDDSRHMDFLLEDYGGGGPGGPQEMSPDTRELMQFEPAPTFRLNGSSMLPQTITMGHSNPLPIGGPNGKAVPTSTSSIRSQINNSAMRFPAGVATSFPGHGFIMGASGVPSMPLAMSRREGLQDSSLLTPFPMYDGNPSQNDDTFPPRSPPLERNLMALGTSHKTVPAMAASPRSLNESMFSFRAGSLTSVEQTEKQRRRKENHNLVERRRRDLINIMISRLALLVSAYNGALDHTLASKMNKGEVLEATVRKMLQINNLAFDLAEQLRQVDPDNPVLQKNVVLLHTLITSLPTDDKDD